MALALMLISLISRSTAVVSSFRNNLTVSSSPVQSHFSTIHGNIELRWRLTGLHTTKQIEKELNQLSLKRMVSLFGYSYNCFKAELVCIWSLTPNFWLQKILQKSLIGCIMFIYKVVPQFVKEYHAHRLCRGHPGLLWPKNMTTKS